MEITKQQKTVKHNLKQQQKTHCETEIKSGVLWKQRPLETKTMFFKTEQNRIKYISKT